MYVRQQVLGPPFPLFFFFKCTNTQKLQAKEPLDICPPYREYNPEIMRNDSINGPLLLPPDYQRRQQVPTFGIPCLAHHVLHKDVSGWHCTCRCTTSPTAHLEQTTKPFFICELCENLWHFLAIWFSFKTVFHKVQL